VARSAVAIAAFLILGHGSAQAAAVDSLRAAGDPVLTLPAVEVLAPRPHSDSLLRITPGFAQGYDVSRARGRALMVSDLLAGAVGVHIRELGAAGSFATASIRGSTPAQVAVYLDGVPLNQAQYGVVNVADLPLEALDQVEVFRGATPITLDSPGGGAINLVTTAQRGRWVRASGGMGSFGTARGDLGMGWQSGRWGALLVAQAMQSQGDYLFDDDNATPFNPDDDEIATRLNNWTRTAGLTARVSTVLGPLGVSLTHDLLRKRYGVPGIGANQVLASSMETDRDLSSLLIERRRDPGAGARPGASVRLFGSWHHDRFADPEGKLTGVRQASDDRTDRGGAVAAIPLVVPGRHRLTFVGEARRERYRPHIVFPTPRTLAESRRDVLAWGVEDHWTVPALRLAVLASWRRSETRDSFPPGPAYPGALPSPSVSRTLVLDRPSVGVTVDLVHGLALKASFAELARAPTLEELFGNRAGVYGNPRALPEHITTGDVGLIGHGTNPASTWLPSMIEIQASAWRSNARDLLVYVPNSQRSMVATNVSAARLWGLEWDGRFVWRSGLTVQSSWTRQWTRDEGGIVYWHGRELPSRPRDEIAVQTALTRRRWRAFYDLHFVAANWLDRYNTDLAAQRTIHDVGLGLRMPFTAVEWTAECRNVSDVRVQDYAGFPLPGRTYYAGLAVQIHNRE
jgi:iron complex outermembrane receptor protein